MTSLKLEQNCGNHIFFLLRGVTQYLHGIDLLFTCLLHLQGMQMVFSMLFLIFTFKDQNLAKNLTNLMDTPNIVGLCRVHGTCFFCNCRGPLTLGWARATPSVKGSGGQDCWGKVEGQNLVEPCFIWSLQSYESKKTPVDSFIVKIL